MKNKVEKEAVVKMDGDLKEKFKKMDSVVTDIEKKFGKGAIMRLGENKQALNVETFSTGIMSFDMALGKGLPKGRIIELYGVESGGKTTTTLRIIAEVQKNGGIAGFIDAEHSIDIVWAKKCGVDVDNLYINQPDSGEQALEVCEAMVRSGAIDLIVVDSVSALVPQAEIDGDMGDSVMGAQARLMSQALRKLTAIVSKSGCTVIFINQLREKIGVMFGNPETTTGGRALKFYSTIRLEVRKKEALKVGGEIVGNTIKIKVVKNKIAPPFKECEFDIDFNGGISITGDLLNVAEKMGIIDKSGAWFTYGKEKIGQGREQAKKYLEEHEDKFNEIKSKVLEEMQNANKLKDVIDAEIEEAEEE